MDSEKELLKNLYNDVSQAIQEIAKDPKQDNLDELKRCLNKFFPDSECLGVLYTRNTDKLFFGIFAFPRIKGDEVVDILFHNARYMVKKYWLELDSKLFDGFLMLTAEEIAALIMHDVSHLVSNSAPAEIVKKEIDRYLANNNEVLKVSDSVHYRGLLAYGFADSMRKYTTIFEEDHYVPDDTIDEFIDWIDFSGQIRSAFYKINQMGMNINREVRNKFITLSWVLRIYKDIAHNRIPALEAIKRCIELSSSQIERQELKNMGARISRIDDDSLLEAHQYHIPEDDRMIKSLREEMLKRPRHTYKSVGLLEGVQEDIDDMVFNKDNFNDPWTLEVLCHDTNKKMALIKDYVDNDSNMSKAEFLQWNGIFKDLDRQRKELYKGRLYSEEKRMINSYSRFGDR